MRSHPCLAVVVVLIAGCAKPPTVQSTPAPAPAAPAARAPVGPFHTAKATIHDLAGARVGSATFMDSYAGVIISGNVSGVGLGAHAIHIHETGKCVPPFTTAGGHFNPEHRSHGYRNPQGPHLGDLPNIDVPAAGTLRFELVLPGVTLEGEHALLDADGASIVIHTSRDDYTTDPAGASGARQACGVIVGT